MNTLQRELEVAFSPRAQPWWFRLTKWSVFIFITARYRKRSWFPYAAILALLGGIALHLFYRWKTQGWQQAWGGWSDLPK
jgi:1-acyl-sn-glycerol-3-phosphate acyltransferase